MTILLIGWQSNLNLELLKIQYLDSFESNASNSEITLFMNHGNIEEYCIKTNSNYNNLKKELMLLWVEIDAFRLQMEQKYLFEIKTKAYNNLIVETLYNLCSKFAKDRGFRIIGESDEFC